MRTIASELAKLAKFSRPKLAEVRSWSVVGRKVGAARVGQWAASLARPLDHPLYSLPSHSRLYFNAVFPPLQNCVLFTFTFVFFSSRQSHLTWSHLCCKQKCGRCIKSAEQSSKISKRQRANYQQLGGLE